MNRLGFAALLWVAAHADPARAQTAAKSRGPRSAEDSAVVRLEQRMWHDWAAGDYTHFGTVLAPDFYNIYADGPGVGKSQVIHDFVEAKLLDYLLGPMTVVRLTPDAMLVVYNARMHGKQTGSEIRRSVDVTAAWAKRGGRWVNVFHRESNPPPARGR
jgi:hypothetical protein